MTVPPLLGCSCSWEQDGFKGDGKWVCTARRNENIVVYLGD